MQQTLTILEAAKLLGVTERHVRRMCVKGKLPGAVCSGGQWKIPVTADSRLLGVKAPEQLSLDVDLTDVPKHKRDEAVRRRGIIEQAERFCGVACSNSIGRVEALQRFAMDHQIAIRTLHRWMAAYKLRGIAGLIDSRGGKTSSDVISPEAWNEFLAMYLTEQRLSIRTCLNNILYIAKSQKKNWTIPSLRTMQQYVNDKIPTPVSVLKREGESAYESKCAPHIIIDQNSVQPGQVWVGDHHEFDCFILHRGNWVRPWITAWEDYRSRKLVGWHISVAPNSSTILRAAKRGIDQFGPPESVKIDNGKDYDSQTFTGQTKRQRRKAVLSADDCQTVMGLYAMLGITVSFAIPYNAKAKKIERWFATLCGQFTKTLPTYCGPDTGRRPEDVFEYMKTDKARAEAYTLETFAALVDRYIAIYNASAHTGDGMNGRSPDQVFGLRVSRRVIDNDLLDLMTKIWSPPLTIGKNGVKFKGFWYGQYNSDLHARFGKKVIVAYDPDDIRSVDVYDAATYKLITIAQQATLMPYGPINEEALREAMAKKSRCVRLVKQSRPAARVAAMSLTDLTLSAMADNAKPETDQAGEPNVKPVRTPLDGQAKEHLRQRNRQQLRKAAGAESLTSLSDLQIDLIDTPQNSDLSGFEMDLLDNNSNRNARLSHGDESL
ncbi:MAG: DDE-type integrase/transposase/recombinase [Planctomycetaceae bacterium]|nr:DDE-type integrase/transposase/recombinase [Planctomycetaceae bacterium]